MRRSAGLWGLLLLGWASCYQPDYTRKSCRVFGDCPEGYACVANQCSSGAEGPMDLAADQGAAPDLAAVTPRTEVYFPRAASFIMGTDGTSANGFDQPSFPLTIPAFYLDKAEVTVAEYRRCVAAGVCTPAGTGGDCNYGYTIHENHPINCVDHSQATAFCAWVGRRLPTEEELELAARGPNGTRFAWGNTDPVPAQLCWNRQGLNTCIEGSYPLNSTAGLSDLAGNVWEWTRSVLKPGEIVYRGGSWYLARPSARSMNREVGDASLADVDIGFRVCQSAPDDEPF